MKQRTLILLLAVSAALLSAACVGEMREGLKVQRALQRQYGDSAEARVTFVNGTRNLRISLWGPALGVRGDSATDAKALAVARFVMREYDRSTDLDSISVAFVLEHEGPLSRFIAKRFAAPQLR